MIRMYTEFLDVNCFPFFLFLLSLHLLRCVTPSFDEGTHLGFILAQVQSEIGVHGFATVSGENIFPQYCVTDFEVGYLFYRLVGVSGLPNQQCVIIPAVQKWQYTATTV